MKSFTKRIATVGMVAVCAVSLFTGVHLLGKGSVSADTSPSAATYFYDTLTDEDGNSYVLAKKFYDAFDEMNQSGDFKDGQIEYSLTEHGILNSTEIKTYAQDGDITVPKAFSAARDAYLTDHPELFYIDFYKITISVARSGNNWSAYIDSGREADVYHDDGFTSEQAVNSAIALYEAKIDEIAAAAVAEANADVYGTDKKVLQAGYVNRYLADPANLEYDYGAYNEYLEIGASSSAASINTAYGALVVGKAVCGGYARAFKAVMDKLEIPCLVVNGYGLSKDEDGKNTERNVAHAWNYIWYENPVFDDEEEDSARARVAAADSEGGQWYAVDSTWNSANRNKSKYMNMGQLALMSDHIIDGVISSSGYELKYPELSSYNYGCKTNSNGLTYGVEYETYTEDGKPMLDLNGNPRVKPVEIVSYNGKSAKTLFAEGLHLAVRYANIDKDESGNVGVQWTVWMDLGTMIDKGEFDGYIIDDGSQTRIPGNASNIYTQFAVMEVEPDLDVNPGDPYGNSLGYNLFYREDETHDPGEYMSAVSELLTNKSYATYAPAPYVASTNPSDRVVITISDSMRDPKVKDKVMMDLKYVQYYEVTYNEDLHILDESKPIGISWISKHSNTAKYAQLLPLEDGSYVQLKEDKRTLRFRFMPSLMYEHNGETYNFSFTNVGSCKVRYNANNEPYITNKLPNPISHSYCRLTVACPARFDYDGRLWVECCAQPTLISNSDLSEVEFRDENGEIYSEQERSQMMLVVDSVHKDTEDAMLNDIHNNKDIDIKKEDIKASETYDINLQMCGKYPKIPNGSYVKIALGFPEGYGPENEGVTFRLYHYKHDDQGNYIGVEEIPCVVTQFGIVATVSSFSPYMVAVVPADKAPTVKTIAANVNGRGGSLNNADGQIRSLKQGDSYTYTIQANKGYQVYKVTLNGQDVTSKIADGKLTVQYADLLNNNQLEMQFIAEKAAQRFEEKGIVDPVKVVVDTDGTPGIALPGDQLAGNKIPASPDKSNSDSNLGLIIGIVAAAVVLGGLVVAISVLLIRKRKATK